jgi:hypothetical protein
MQTQPQWGTTPVGISIIKKTKENILVRIWIKKEPLHTVGGMLISIITMENRVEGPQKIQTEEGRWQVWGT